MPESYEFLIEVVDRIADGYRLRVAFPDPDSPTGVGENRVVAPFDPDDPILRQQLAGLPTSVLASAARARLARSPMEMAVQEVGHRLFQAVMVGETLGDLSRLRRRAQAAGADVRISLRIQPAELAVLPWEFLYDARPDKREFLGRACMVTRSSGDLSPVPRLAVGGPLRVLAMVSLPGDQTELDTERERAYLTEALAPMAADGRMELHWIPATKQALLTATQQQAWHIFHYIGHGDFDAATGDGRLAFTGPAGATDFVTARQLSTILGTHPTLRLAVLNACQSSQSSAEDRQSGIASALVHSGLAAVVAMQFPITDDAAPVFSREFYRTLAAGRPVDHCVRAGRTAITMANDGSLEWGTPVLHLRSADGLLFAQPARVTSADTDTVAPEPQPEPRPEREPEPEPEAGSKPGVEAEAGADPEPDPVPGQDQDWWRPEPAPSDILGDNRTRLLAQLGKDFIAAHQKILHSDFSDSLVSRLENIVAGYESLRDDASAARARRALERARAGLAGDRGVRMPPPPKPSPADTIPPDDDEDERPRSKTTRTASSGPASAKPRGSTATGVPRSSKTEQPEQPERPPFTFAYSSPVPVPSPVRTLAFSLADPVPRLAIGCDDGVVHVLDPSPGVEPMALHHQTQGTFRARPEKVRQVAFGPFGRSIACLTGDGALPTHLTLWDAVTGARLSNPSVASHFAYHPGDPDWFLAASTGSDLSLRRFDDPFHAVVGYAGLPFVREVAVSPDGRYVCAGQRERFVVWELGTGAVVRTVKPNSWLFLTGLTFTADSEAVLATHSDGSLVAHRVGTGATTVHVPAGRLTNGAAWALGPGGLILTMPAVQGMSARFHSLARPGTSVDLPGRFSAAARPVFSPDGDFVAVLDADGRTVHLFDVEGEL